VSDPRRVKTIDTSDVVELTVPADSAYVSVLRTVTAALAARRDFTIEEIDDLRIAIDEAGALLLPFAQAASTLTAVFSGPAQRLCATVTLTRASEGAAIDETGFAWLVLAALADDVHTDHAGDRLSVTLEKSRPPRG